MCFNFEVSLGTFAFSWSSALYLLQTQSLTKIQKHNLIFLMIFSTVQLLDAILWWNKMKRNEINFFVTSYLIPFVLSAQIIYNLFIRNTSNTSNTVNLYAITLGFTGYIFMRFHGYSKSVCDNYFSSPIWGGKELTYLELVAFLIFSVYPNWNAILLGMVAFPIMMHVFNGGYGSLWCAVANLWTIYYLYAYR